MFIERFKFLDCLRFVAAISVVVYHMSFSMFPDNTSLLYFTKYGLWGVVLFFMISGFVVTKSAIGKSPWRFLKGRAVRLYPAYWLSLLYVSLIIWLIGEPVAIVDFFVNLTMFQEFVGVDHLNGVYWTLSFELMFYFYIFICVTYLRLDVRIFLITWAICLGFATFFKSLIAMKLLLGYYSFFFMFGVALFQLYAKQSIINFLLCFCCLLLMSYSVYYYINDYSAYLNMNFSGFGVLCYFFASLVFAVLLSFCSTKIAEFLGELSYPLYLVHSPSIWFLKTYVVGVGGFITLLLIFVVSGILLYLEKKFREVLLK